MAAKIISISSFKVSGSNVKFCLNSCNRIRERTMRRILEKTELQRLLLSYMYPLCITFISYDMYMAYKCLFNYILQKQKSAYVNNSGKSVTTAQPVERFLPKVVRL